LKAEPNSKKMTSRTLTASILLSRQLTPAMVVVAAEMAVANATVAEAEEAVVVIVVAVAADAVRAEATADTVATAVTAAVGAEVEAGGKGGTIRCRNKP
jgi:hypothetical protein